MSRNPDWTKDELILALNLYFQNNNRQLDATHPDVIKLSQLLNQLPIHGEDFRKSDFRNPQGVSMKLGNFASLDPNYEGVGLSRGGKADKEVWNEFAGDIERLGITAISIAKSTAWIQETAPTYEVSSDDEFPEGKILTRLHKRKERNRKAVNGKKKKVIQETGKLICEVCGFDFAEFYGNLGVGFAECHHIVPISELSEGHKTRLSDLAIVCANCHRMLHKSRPMLSVEELTEVIKQRNK